MPTTSPMLDSLKATPAAIMPLPDRKFVVTRTPQFGGPLFLTNTGTFVPARDASCTFDSMLDAQSAILVAERRNTPPPR